MYGSKTSMLEGSEPVLGSASRLETMAEEDHPDTDGTDPDSQATGMAAYGSGTSLASKMKKAQKKANLYAWLCLQQLPEV